MHLVTLAPAARARADELARTKGGPVPIRSPFFGPWAEPFAGAWQQHLQIDPIGQLTSFGAVYACISRIANDVGKLQPKLLQDGPNDFEVAASAQSPFWKTLTRPNQYQNRIQFIVYWLTCKLLFGNAYVLKQRETLRGMVSALHVLDPRRVTPMITGDGDVYYSLAGSDIAQIPAGKVVPASEMIHDRAVTLWHTLIGVSPLFASALSATQGLRIQRNSATFFENMSRPSGMLTSPHKITDETADRLKRDWERNYSAGNLGRLAIGDNGLKYEPMTIPAEGSQLIEQLEWTVADVARTFGVPLYKINAGPMPTSNNVEALELQYYTGCLQPLIEAMELCMTEGLEMPFDYCVELDLDGLTRMDTGAQIEGFAKAIGSAQMAPNEARARRRMKPMPGGDSLYLQEQNYSTEALAKRDAKDDPFAGPKPPPAKPPALAAPAAPPEAPPEAAAQAAAVSGLAAKLLGMFKQARCPAT